MTKLDYGPSGTLIGLLYITLVSVGSILLLMLVASSVSDHTAVNRLLSGYPDDTIHHLSRWQGIGLALLSFAAISLLLLLSWIQTHYLQTRWNPSYVTAIFDLLIIVIVYWLLLSVAPQYYYEYYRSLMPGLPVQLVVKTLLPPQEYLQIYAMSSTASLSHHAAGVTGWLLVLNKLQQWIMLFRNTR